MTGYKGRLVGLLVDWQGGLASEHRHCICVIFSIPVCVVEQGDLCGALQLPLVEGCHLCGSTGQCQVVTGGPSVWIRRNRRPVD